MSMFRDDQSLPFAPTEAKTPGEIKTIVLPLALISDLAKASETAGEEAPVDGFSSSGPHLRAGKPHCPMLFS